MGFISQRSAVPGWGSRNLVRKYAIGCVQRIELLSIKLIARVLRWRAWLTCPSDSYSRKYKYTDLNENVRTLKINAYFLCSVLDSDRGTYNHSDVPSRVHDMRRGPSNSNQRCIASGIVFSVALQYKCVQHCFFCVQCSVSSSIVRIYIERPH